MALGLMAVLETTVDERISVVPEVFLVEHSSRQHGWPLVGFAASRPDI